MARLKRMEDKVEYLLKKYPKTRDDDRLLVGAVYTCFYGVDVGHTSFKEVLLNDKLPNFETIRRCRQKVQEKHENLRGSKAKEKARLNAQKEYIEYAKEGKKTDRSYSKIQTDVLKERSKTNGI